MGATKALPKHYVRRFPVGGANYNGVIYETGEAIKLIGARNDDKLLAYGYIAEWPKEVKETFECGACGKAFFSEQTRRRHGDKTHRHVYDEELMDPRVTDEQLDAEEMRLNKDLPYLVPSAIPEEITVGAPALPDV